MFCTIFVRCGVDPRVGNIPLFAWMWEMRGRLLKQTKDFSVHCYYEVERVRLSKTDRSRLIVGNINPELPECL